MAEINIDPSNIGDLKNWLQNKLKTICEADPIPLAQYVLALVKKKKTEDELKKVCLDQLDVFLIDSTPKFVEEFFECLKNKSYLKAATQVKEKSASEKKETKQEKNKEKEQESKKVEKVEKGKSSSSKTDTPKEKKEKKSESSRSAHKHSTTSSSSKPSRLSSSSTDKHHHKSAHSKSHRSKSRSRSRSPILRRNHRHTSRERQRSPSPARRKGPSPISIASGKASSAIPSTAHCTSLLGAAPIGSVVSAYSPLVPPPMFNQTPTAPLTKLKERCKDFDELGYCTLAEMCPFDHGSDPVVLDNSNIQTILSFPAENKKTAKSGGQPISTIISDEVNGKQPRLTMNKPKATVSPNIINLALTNNTPNYDSSKLVDLRQKLRQSRASTNQPITSENKEDAMDSRRFVALHNNRENKPFQRQFVLRELEGKCCSLLINRIPKPLNTLGKLTSHFEKFGTLTNIRICYGDDPSSALIEFSNPSEASAAFRSPEPILSNRFIRIYFHQENAPQPRQHQFGNKNETVVKSNRKRRLEERLGPVNTPVKETIVNDDDEEEEDWDKGDNIRLDEDLGSDSLQLENSGTYSRLDRVADKRRESFVIDTDDEDEEEEDGEVKESPRKILIRRNATTASEGKLINSASQKTGPLSSTPLPKNSFNSEFVPVPNTVTTAAPRASLSTDRGVPLSVRYMNQMRNLLSQYEACKESNEKKQLLTAIKKINKSISEIKEKGAETVKRNPSNPNVTPPSVFKEASSVPQPSEYNKKKNELKSKILDVEMEIYKEEDPDKKKDVLKKMADLKREMVNLDAIPPPTKPISHLSLKAATKLDNRSKTLYIVGHEAEMSKDLRRMFSITNFHLDEFQEAECPENNIPVAVVTFSSRDHADMAIRAVNSFHGHPLTLTYSNPYPKTLKILTETECESGHDSQPEKRPKLDKDLQSDFLSEELIAE